MSVALNSQSHLGYASHTNPSVTAPSGITNGDVLLMAAVTFSNTTAPTVTPPTGWVAAPGSTGGLLYSDTNFDGDNYNMKLWAWTKVASSEPGSYSITQAAGSSDYWIGDYTGVNTSTPMASGWTTDNGTGATSTALGVTSTVNGSRIVIISADDGDYASNTTTPSGSTPTFTMEIASPVVLEIFDGTLATAGPTGNKTFTNDNDPSSGWDTVMLVLNAVSGATVFLLV